MIKSSGILWKHSTKMTNFHDRLNGVENMTAVLAKATFSDLQTLKTRINRHDKDLDLLDKNLQNFLTARNDEFYRMTKTLKNHHLAIKMLTKVSTVYAYILRKYMGLYDACYEAFHDFVPVLDVLSNT